jgi:hypothetical protein
MKGGESLSNLTKEINTFQNRADNKKRVLCALAGLAFGFAVPTIAEALLFWPAAVGLSLALEPEWDCG